MTVTPEAKDKIKEMLQMCYAFLLHQMPEILTKGEPSQSFDLELECPADLLYKECKLRTVEVGKVHLNLTFFAPERKVNILLPFGRPKGADGLPLSSSRIEDGQPQSNRLKDSDPKPEPPDPED